MTDDSIRVLKTVKYSAITVGVLMVAGILALMVLARGKTGDDGRHRGRCRPSLVIDMHVRRGRCRCGCPSEARAADDAPVAFVRRVSIGRRKAHLAKRAYCFG